MLWHDGNMGETAASLLSFWTQDVGEAGWYRSSDAIDEGIRTRFRDIWDQGVQAQADPFDGDPLAAIILFDQFPRNMFRGQAKAFASDELARSLVHKALSAGADLETPEPLRQFYYLPLEHSEDLADQDEAVRLIESRVSSVETLLHARAHRRVIREFGRFPFRNVALGRDTTAQEAAFLEAGAYPALVRKMREEVGIPDPDAASGGGS